MTRVPIDVYDNARSVADSERSLTAKYDDMAREAGAVASFAGEVAEIAWALQRTLANGDLLLSAALDPGGSANSEAALVAAVDGPRGLVLLAAAFELRAAGLRTSVDVYRAVDAALGRLTHALRWEVGEAIGEVFGPQGSLLLAGGFWAIDQATDGGVQHWLGRHAAALQEVAADAFPGLLTGWETHLGLPTIPVLTIPEAAGVLSALYTAGPGHAEERNHRFAGDRAPNRAHPVASLLAGLCVVDAGEKDGKFLIDIKKIDVHNADGTTTPHWIVNLPGLHGDAWPGPGTNVADLGAAFRSMAGQRTAYQEALEEAMTKAGVGKNQPIMFVGHSLGGMVALQAAGDLTARGYEVTHVLTAGSPLAEMSPPPSVRVLSIENITDVVPALDGADNPTTANWTTVKVALPRRTIGENHGLATYAEPEPTDTIDNSTRASLAEWRSSVADAGYFSGTPETSVWQLRAE
jgi:hypothetical protein